MRTVVRSAACTTPKPWTAKYPSFFSVGTRLTLTNIQPERHAHPPPHRLTPIPCGTGFPPLITHLPDRPVGYLRRGKIVLPTLESAKRTFKWTTGWPPSNGGKARAHQANAPFSSVLKCMMICQQHAALCSADPVLPLILAVASILHLIGASAVPILSSHDELTETRGHPAKATRRPPPPSHAYMYASTPTDRPTDRRTSHLTLGLPLVRRPTEEEYVMMKWWGMDLDPTVD